MKWVLFLAWSLHTVASSQQCRTSYYVSDRRLKGHVILTEIVKDHGHCLIVCWDEPKCQSANFNVRNLTCELNDVDRHAYPQDYEFKNGFTYSDHYSEVLFKQNMTPSWLSSNASYINSNHMKTNQQITFQRGNFKKFASLLKVPLVAAGVLSDNMPLTIRIVVANDVNIAQSTDTDPSYGLSDGTNFVGFKTPDEGSYDKRQPCFGLEGFSGAKLNVSNNAIESKGDEDGISFPDKFVFTFKLNQEKGGMPWGKCFIAQGEGFTREVQYRKRRLKLNRGLTLEVYKTSANEEVGIKYIEVIICLDSCPLH